jgi:glycosyltransferase involved in cell wall biosynthesis
MGLPLVSIGLQFFNNEKTLHLAITSILNQTYQNWELILHNDGSSDRSLDIARRFSDPRIRLFTDDANLKRPKRLNTSLRLAQGKYYAIMDGDDIAYPDRIIKQVECLEIHPSVDLVGAGMLVFGKNGEAIGKRQPPLTHAEIVSAPWAGFPIAQPTFMGRLDWFRKYYYDERALGGVEDQDLLLRSYRTSTFANLPCILMGYRESDLSLKKIIAARYAFSKSLTRCYSSRSNWVWLARSLAGQLIKACVDCIGIRSGLKYRLLRHRANPVNADERGEWRRIFSAVAQNASFAYSQNF